MNRLKFDTGILGGRVVDGAGNPWYYGDVGIKGKEIAKIGRIDRKDCGRAIDAKGLYVCPGFIDIHTHSDITALVFPGCDSTLRQGVTTHLIGNCGSSAAPLREPFIEAWKIYWGEWAGAFEKGGWRTFGEYLKALEKNGLANPGVRLWTSSRLPLDVKWRRDGDRITSLSLRGEGRLVYRGILGEPASSD